MRRLSTLRPVASPGIIVSVALAVTITVLVWVAVGSSASLAREPTVPGKEWARKTPAEARLDGPRLEVFSRHVGGRGCVVRHGYLVHTWGDVRRRGDVASASKPWFAHFLFKAIEDGKISGLDEKVRKWEPRLDGINEGLAHKDRNITWRHLATQTSCYGVREKPGEAFCYNDWQMALFWDTLFLKVHGASLEDVDRKVLRPSLTDILECQDRPTFLAFGARDRPGRVGVSPRDFARFGLLYLGGGKWRGKQLLDAKLVRQAVTSPLPNTVPRAGETRAEMIPGQRSLGSRKVPDNQTDHLGSYSWLWWTNGVDRHGKRHWPAAPLDTYGAFGHGGPRALVVIPSLDLVVSWNDTRVRGRQAENRALELLVSAVTDK
ncbi:MAG: serine hydrolase [Planctomycetota bacterium]|nr:serine hydrolase [Planctomycetota bacterium]